MKTPQLNERVLALCLLIAKEEDPGKFQLLAQELNNVLENGERKVEHAPSPTARHTAKVISTLPHI